MTDYQKITILLIRVMGLFFMVLGITYAFISTISILILYKMFYMKYLFYATFYWLPWIILGITLFMLSKKLSLWICEDLD